MSKNTLSVLNDSAGFHMNLSPATWNKNIALRITRDAKNAEAFSVWSTHASTSTLNMYAARALQSLKEGVSGEVAIVKIGNNQYAAERTNSKMETTICTCTSNGRLSAAVISPKGVWTAVPTLPAPNGVIIDLSPVWAVFMMLIANTDLVNDVSVQTSVKKAMETFITETDADKLTIAAHYVSDTLYRGFADGHISGVTLTNGNIPFLPSQRVTEGRLNGEVICGHPHFLNGGEGVKVQKILTAKEAKAMFSEFAKTRRWTKEEKQFIPQFEDDYPVLPETIKIAQRYVNSRDAKRPLNNFLWRGITAYGKSTGTEMLAYLLNTPLLRVTCSSTMEAGDFLSNFIPDSSAEGLPADLPTFTEIECDPSGAYEKLTGTYLPDVSGDEVFAELLKRVGSGGGNTVRYKLVESNYVKALRKGYIVEIQEISRIKDPGVLVSLNEYDRAGAVIPLANGNYAKRHPNALVVYSDNIGYVSCRPVDPSVMRRMDSVFDSYELSDEQVLARVKYNTGYDDKDRLKGMLKIWKAVIDYCKDQEITDGEISVNELERWVNVLQIEGDAAFESACRECVVAKASPDRFTQEEIMQRAVTPLMDAMQ